VQGCKITSLPTHKNVELSRQCKWGRHLSEHFSIIRVDKLTWWRKSIILLYIVFP